MIKSKELISRIGLKELNKNADDYYKRFPIPNRIMAKPFANISEAPMLLYKLAFLLDGLNLGLGMVVLDFGSGACWLSKILNQLRCSTISLDVSATALSMGEILFKDFPIIGDCINPPQFLLFDGIKVDLEDESVDRIVCFDAFHHIHDQEAILREFFRVLKSGGIIGFSEPGINHSSSTEAQKEMHEFGVLENDIDVKIIEKLALEIGFTRMRLKLHSGFNLELISSDTCRLPSDIVSGVPEIPRYMSNATEREPIFFLEKGVPMQDSRQPVGLSCNIVAEGEYPARVGQAVNIPLLIKNCGSTKWLCSANKDMGAVKVGGHLKGKDGSMIENDFLRSNLTKDIIPGEEIKHTLTVQFDRAGEYILALDMVSEYVTWFGQEKLIKIDIS